MRRRTFLISLSATLAATPAWAASSMRTVRYAKTRDVDAKLQSLDVYGVEEGARKPIIAFIHGGAWSGGDKSLKWNGRSKAKFFTSRGFVFASINYRLSPKVKHPAHVEDVATAVAWLRQHAAEIGGDPDRLYLMGHSAGAHLAALLSTDERRLAAHGETLSAVKGAILIDGAGYDVMAQTQGAPEWAQGFIRSVLGPDESAWDDASPVRHIAAGKHIPPFLITYTARPESIGQSIELGKLLNKAGVEAKLYMSANQNHAHINSDIGIPNDPVTGEIIAALARWGAPS